MKKINKFIYCYAIICVLAGILVNIVFAEISDGRNMTYNIYVNRVKKEIADSEYKSKKAVEDFNEILAVGGEYIEDIESRTGEPEEDFFSDKRKYVIHKTEYAYYKIVYREDVQNTDRMIFFFNISYGFVFIAVISFMIYIRHNIIKPFYKFEKLPYELSKGNLVVPVKENKSRFFGRYLWGMDLLREKLENDRIRELEQIKEKKTLLLSLSHDIKTPLSAIKLYSKAISRDLYKTEEKRKEIAEKIDVQADKIDEYISEIVKASKEDFLTFELENGEFYIAEVFEKIDGYYKEKMELNMIDFSIAKVENCIVTASKERLIEVMENVIENAIKYGDRKRIWIENSHNSEEYIISVKNTGCTLEDKELLHIFDSFYRGSNTKNKNGSGLGLYIAKCLIHLMDGEILAYKHDNNIMEIRIIIRMEKKRQM